MTKTILVLGATGTVGTPLVEELAARGAEVRAATRNPSKLADAPRNVRGVAFDYADASTFSPALEGVDAVFLLAPTGNAESHRLIGPFLEHAKGRVRKIVTMTAAGVEYDDSVPLRRVELQAAASAPDWVHLRPGWFMQNFNTFWLPTIAARGTIEVPAGDARVAFIDARDIAAAAAAVLTRPDFDGRGLTLTGPEAKTYAEAAAILSSAAARTIRYVPVDDDAFRTALIASGALPADYAAALTAVFGLVRQGSAASVDPVVETVLGRPPRSLEAYARDYAAAFRG